jgi:hypothetical protein
MLGVFAGERFAVGGQPPPGAGNAAIVIPSLTFVFIVEGGEGKQAGRFKILAPDKKTAITDSPIEKIEMVRGRPSIFVSGAKPFIGPAFGTYTAQLEIGNAKFKFPFTIEKGIEPKSK